ncbi:MAG TPA: four helix bundle protein [Terriglobia bacterium]|nr:four helix bundle protein [Terriglobia bacterium]
MVEEKRDLAERLLEYGAAIIELTESLPNTLVGRRVGDQLLRCSTSAGANYEEARAAESKEDFIHKLQIALKELRESNYWLRLLNKSGKVTDERITRLLDESNQFVQSSPSQSPPPKGAPRRRTENKSKGKAQRSKDRSERMKGLGKYKLKHKALWSECPERTAGGFAPYVLPYVCTGFAF